MKAQTHPRALEVQTHSFAPSGARRVGAGVLLPEHVIPGFAPPPLDADRAAWNAAFEDAYASAGGDLNSVPWSRGGSGGPDPALVAWLDSEAPGLLRPGASVVVAGCGTGDDAAELAARGYDVAAFDVSRTAVEWCRERFPHLAGSFHQADLLELAGRRMLEGAGAGRVLRRADLVIDVEMLSWLPPSLRPEAAAAMVALMRPHGMLVVVCSCAENAGETCADGGEARMPFGVAADELRDLMAAQSLGPVAPLSACGGDSRLCAAFRRL